MLKWFKFLKLYFHIKLLPKNWVQTANEVNERRFTLFMLDINKYVYKRDHNDVLFIYHWLKKYDENVLNYTHRQPYKYNVMYSDKQKNTDITLSLDYEDIKKIMYYDDLYLEFKNDFIYRIIPDDKLSDDGLYEFITKVESYPSVKLKQLRSRLI